MSDQTRELQVSCLARVEGEGALNVKIHDGVVERAELSIYEAPRFFEAFLRGRSVMEVPDIAARICGICPVAYQTSACNGVEALCGVVLDPQLAALRRLMFCGEWIESHVLHMYMLHAPDFLGYHDAITYAFDHPGPIERGLALKKTGNEILELLGGRAIHPINVRIGGFYSTPTKKQMGALGEELKVALEQAIETVHWVAGFTYPELELEHELVALADGDLYPIEKGSVVRSAGEGFEVEQYMDHVVEEHVAHSTALHARIDGHTFLTGPLARYTLHYDKLSPLAKQLAAEAGLGTTCRNPFKSLIVRAVETVYAIEEAIRIIDQYEQPAKPYMDFEFKAGVARGACEAPRGIQYEEYEIDEQGIIKQGRIVPPTSQNQLAIEDDLLSVLNANMEMDDAALTGICETAIRNYDPCISCSTHFLKLSVERS